MGHNISKTFHIKDDNISQSIAENYKILNKITTTNANTLEEIRNGLMYRTIPLELNHGMLFHMDKYKIHNFWMKNTYIPLDIIFLNKIPKLGSESINKFSIVGFIKNAKPMSEKKLSINKPSTHVLEMNAGWVKKNNALKDDIIIIN